MADGDAPDFRVKFVQIAASGDLNHGHFLYGLDADGCVWEWNQYVHKWEQMPWALR